MSIKRRFVTVVHVSLLLFGSFPVLAENSIDTTVVDGDTRDGYVTVLGDPASTKDAGRVWADHTVSEESLSFSGETETVIEKNADEDFLVTYSALASTAEISVLESNVQSDTVFVLDFSMTMNYDLETGAVVGDDKFLNTRTRAMLDSMDETIANLKSANPDNRVGIVTFCGISDVLLPLTRVGDIEEITEETVNAPISVKNYGGDKEIIYSTEHGYFSASEFYNNTGSYRRSWVRCNIGGEVNMLSDWTSLQSGLYEGLKMFRQGWETVDQEILKNSQANVIVITDGDSNTLAGAVEGKAWYEDMQTDKQMTGIAGGELAFPTLLTAAYLRYELEERYGSCSVYTVGLSTTEMMRLLLNPKEYISDNSQNSTVKNVLSRWQTYQNGNEQSIRGINFKPVYDDAGTIVPDDLLYETMAFDISNSGDLADAFQKITNEITIVEPQPPTEVGEDIRLSGYITYTAPIGEYMEVKDVRCIIYQDIVFTEKTKSADGLAYTFSGVVDSPVYGTQSLSDIQIQVIEEDGRQIMTIKIPASVIPMRSNTIQLKSTLPEDIRSHETEDWKPMRIVYSVGLASNINRDTLSGVSPDYIEKHKDVDGNVLFYCNQFTSNQMDDKTVGNVTAEFTAGKQNPFYYATEGTVLYTFEDGIYSLASVYEEGMTYYIRQDYYQKDENGHSEFVGNWLGRELTEGDTSQKTTEDGTTQLVLSQSVLKQVSMDDARSVKEADENDSETAQYAYYATEKENSPGSFVAYLGNNGRLSVKDPSGEVTVSKTLQPADGEQLPDEVKKTAFALNLTATLQDNALTGQFYYALYSSNQAEPVQRSLVFDENGKAKVNIQGGQVLRLFIPRNANLIVEETIQDGYAVSYKEDNVAVVHEKESNFTANVESSDIRVINTYYSPINLPVKKIWDDGNNFNEKRPDSITIQLYKNGGTEPCRELALSEDNKWMGQFENLVVYEAGKKNTYTIAEVYVPGYETVISGDENGFTVTNTSIEPLPETGGPGDLLYVVTGAGMIVAGMIYMLRKEKMG